MSNRVTVYDMTEAVDVSDPFVELARLLPRAPDRATPIHCKRCGAHLGCMVNSRAVALGSFEWRARGGGRLLSAAVISERRVSIACTRCGNVRLWHRAKEG